MVKVQVSPFLNIPEWHDSYSGLTFSKSAGVITIPDGLDLTGIKKNIRLNQLFVVSGDISKYKEIKKEPISVPQASTRVEAKIVKPSDKVDKKALDQMTVSKLKEIAKERNIPGYPTMKKNELVKAVNYLLP